MISVYADVCESLFCGNDGVQPPVCDFCNGVCNSDVWYDVPVDGKHDIFCTDHGRAFLNCGWRETVGEVARSDRSHCGFVYFDHGYDDDFFDHRPMKHL